MKTVTLLFSSLLVSWSAMAFASPLIDQWAGSGMDADKTFCEYGNGEVKVVYGNQNCPLSN